MRRLASLVVITLVSLPNAAAGSSDDASKRGATCSDQHKVRFSPGIMTTAGRVAFSTEVSPITCVGEISGRQVTGPGSAAHEGALEGDCSHGTGAGTASITVPTVAGAMKLSIPYTLTYGPGFGDKSADGMSATFEYHPSEGDCINAPVTEIDVVQQTFLE